MYLVCWQNDDDVDDAEYVVAMVTNSRMKPPGAAVSEPSNDTAQQSPPIVSADTRLVRSRHILYACVCVLKGYKRS